MHIKTSTTGTIRLFARKFILSSDNKSFLIIVKFELTVFDKDSTIHRPTPRVCLQSLDWLPKPKEGKITVSMMCLLEFIQWSKIGVKVDFAITKWNSAWIKLFSETLP